MLCHYKFAELPTRRAILRGAVTEFLAMALFIFFGCGAPARNAYKRPGIGPREGEQVWEPASVIVISLQFGFAITVLVYATAHISGGHINCAVTYALTLMGKCHPLIGIFYFIAQMLGSIVGALFLNAVVSADAEALDRSSSLGANAIQMSSATIWTALLVEAVSTFLLIFVVFSTAIDPEAVTTEGSKSVNGNKMSLAPIPIGLAVFMAHVVCVPLTGCSINPTRSFGPAVVANVWKDHWIWWIGPLLGASFAAAFWSVIQGLKEPPKSVREATAFCKEEKRASSSSINSISVSSVA